MNHNCPSSFLMTKIGRLWMWGVPIFGNTYRLVRGYWIIRFGSNNMAKQNADCSIPSTGLYRLAGCKCFSVDSRPWHDSAEDTQAEFTTPRKSISEL